MSSWSSTIKITSLDMIDIPYLSAVYGDSNIP
jgi:hypothetical protein